MRRTRYRCVTWAPLGTALLLAACSTGTSPAATATHVTSASPDAPAATTLTTPPHTASAAIPSRSSSPGRLASPSASPQTGGTRGTAQAQAVITGAAPSADGKSYELSGVVVGVIEDGGSCVFTLSRAGVDVTRSQSGLADAAGTSCGSVSVPRTDLSPGAWSATLTYTGSAGVVASSAADVTVR